MMGNGESGETACCGMERVTTLLSNEYSWYYSQLVPSMIGVMIEHALGTRL